MKSSSNRFYTIMIVPEKTTQVRKILIPAWVVRLSAVAIAVMIVLVGVMIANYGYVMSQVGENNELKTENRRLRQNWCGHACARNYPLSEGRPGAPRTFR